MTALLVLGGAGAVSWVLRVLFIALVPAPKLPQRFRAALTSAGPAAMAALLATEFIHTRSVGTAQLLPWVTGAAVAGLLAHRFGNLGVTVFGGTIAYWTASLLS